MLNNTNQRPEDESLERLLGSFTPAPVEIDRDQLMFQAGMRAAQAASAELPSLTLRARFWPALAVVSTAAAVVLAVIAWQGPERIVIVERPVEEQLADTTVPQPRDSIPQPQLADDEAPWHDPSMNYVRQRELLLRGGPDALTSSPLAGGDQVPRAIPTQRDLLKELPGDYGRQKYQIDSETWWQSWLISGERL